MIASIYILPGGTITDTLRGHGYFTEYTIYQISIPDELNPRITTDGIITLHPKDSIFCMGIEEMFEKTENGNFAIEYDNDNGDFISYEIPVLDCRVASVEESNC